MSPGNPRKPRHVGIRRVLELALLFFLTLMPSLVTSQQDNAPPLPKRENRETRAVFEAQCTDGSILKLTLLDERLEFLTPYGHLLIPVRDIKRIEVAFRLPEEAARRIEAAINDLGKEDFAKREAASATLLELRERAYPALEKALKSSDAEVVRRSQELLDKIREEVPEELLQFRSQDVVHTADSRNTGRFSTATLTVRTAQFGEQKLRWSDVLEIRSPDATVPQAAEVIPNPGSLSTYLGQVGKVYTFRVTGNVVGGWVWGTFVYTLDSNLSMAAVHAGVLKAGESGTVRVRILGAQPGFAASLSHGVNSQAYGPYNGSFEFVRGGARANRGGADPAK